MLGHAEKMWQTSACQACPAGWLCGFRGAAGGWSFVWAPVGIEVFVQPPLPVGSRERIPW